MVIAIPTEEEIRVTEDVSLQVVSGEYAPELFHLTNKNRSYLRQWLPWLDSINGIEDSSRFIQHNERLHKQGKGIQFFIFYHNQLAGVAGFHNRDSLYRKADIGYWLDEELNGKGIMTNCVIALLKFGFSDLNLRKIGIRCAIENRKSRNIPERLGFELIATRKQCEWLYDHYVDHAIYSLEREDFNNITNL